ncbi:MAG TPA: hypothetical protein VII06_07640 [Chloroflexota bacterium]|jgi:hypothetical protein
MERMRAELARGVERYIFRRVAADPSPLLDDHTREIIAEAIAWAVVHGLSTHLAAEPHGEDTSAPSRLVRPVALRR